MSQNNTPPHLTPNHPHPCKHEADFSILNAAVLEIKDTLRDLKDLLTSNAVLEERAEQFRKDIDSIFSRVRKLEISVANHSGAARWIERVVWAIVSLALAGMLVAGKISGV